MIKQLVVPFLPQVDSASSMEEVSAALEGVEKHAIATAPWPAFSYLPGQVEVTKQLSNTLLEELMLFCQLEH